MPTHIYNKILGIYASILDIENPLIKIERALSTWFELYAATTPANFDAILPFLQKFDELIPEKTRYVNVKGKPIMLRHLVVGMRQHAAPLCILALVEDFQDDDMFTVLDVVNPNTAHTVSLACENNKGETKYLHGIPFHLMARPYLLQFCPQMFPCPDVWVSPFETGKHIPIGNDSVTSWSKAFGSLSEYDKRRQKALKGLLKPELNNQTFIVS